MFVDLKLCSHLTAFDMNCISPLVVFHHREAGQEASDDRGLCHDGHLQCWNHISPNCTGVCVCVCVCNANLSSTQRYGCKVRGKVRNSKLTSIC